MKVVDQPPADPLASAAEHAQLGLPLAPATRLKFAKQTMFRVGRIFLDKQMAYNQAVVHAIQNLRDRLGEVRQSTSDLAAVVRSEISQFQLAITEAQTRVALMGSEQTGAIEMMHRLEHQLAETQDRLNVLIENHERDRQRQRTQQSIVELFLREVRRHYPATPERQALAELPSGDSEFYQALEQAFRGSFDEIKDRLRVYIDDVKAVASEGKVLDLGTGRGEWLELLSENGIDAYGVDTGAAAVELSRQRGLKVEHADALEHLAAVPDASLGAVTGFQFAEHIEFDALLDVVDNAARVLRPGGLLILETPNPRNVVVGGSDFYLDPTHRRPLPPQLLEFLVGARGFEKVETRYLHPLPSPYEWPDEHDDVIGSLQPFLAYINEIIWGPRDVAVLARRVTD